MASPLDPLYSYDRALEDAWRGVLQAAFDADGSPAVAFIEQSDDNKNTPYVDIQLRDVSALEQRRVVGGAPLWSSWRGHLVSRVTTKRGKNSNLQSGLIGTIRVQAALFRDLLTPDNLPNHAVLEMRDVGLHRGLIHDLLFDWSEVIHEIKFSIRNQVWPS